MGNNMEIDHYSDPESNLVELLKTPRIGELGTSDMGDVSILTKGSLVLTPETPIGILGDIDAELVSSVDRDIHKPPINEAPPESDKKNSIKCWLKKQRVKLACGAFAVSAGLTFSLAWLRRVFDDNFFHGCMLLPIVLFPTETISGNYKSFP